ncbi:MAG: sodium-translocating pyrophosphatase, partial [Anaerolineae bacterium]|nr:sodium-translocating pyrophosphatase [Anaerolineae bacterium]
MVGWQIVTLAAGALSLGMAAYFYTWVMRQPNDSKEMAEFSQAIQEGAAAYLKRLYRALGLLAVGVAVILLLTVNWQTALAYVIGAGFSAAAGYAGMYVATRANARVAWAARSGLQEAFPVGFFAGGVMGMSVVGVALIGMTLIYMIFRGTPLEGGAPSVVLGFSFGASTMALLAKAGGGIYTKTADIAADLVGKVEFGMAEDDPRNPAVVADNVGDNVGDVAGMGSDIFDSYVASVVAVMILGFELYRGSTRAELFVVFPLILSALGIFASVLGMLFVRTGGRNDPGRALNTGTVATTLILALMVTIVCFLLPFDQPWGLILPTVFGLGAGVVLGFTTDKYTDIDQAAVQTTAKAAMSGPALVIIEGFSYGLISIVPSMIGIAGAMVASFLLAQVFGVPGTYGVSLAAVGMLAITGMIVSSDAYGPIVDNARGCAEMGHEDDATISVCDRLDAAGNTAKAITKGFAIGAAALTVLALFSAYAETVGLSTLSLTEPTVVAGLFLGAMMPPYFSALLMLSVGRNAELMVAEIRRQFKEIPGVLAGTVKPDSTLCVDIATRGALKELVLPAALSLVTPFLVGLLLGVEALGGFL